jgi:hypothetical protein
LQGLLLWAVLLILAAALISFYPFFQYFSIF